MAIMYTWEITRLMSHDRYDLQGVAVQACFDIHAEEDGLKGFVQGDVELNQPDPGNFLPLESVSHEQVIEWVKNALGDRLKMYYNLLQSQIDSQRVAQPQPVNMPWMKQPE